MLRIRGMDRERDGVGRVQRASRRATGHTRKAAVVVAMLSAFLGSAGCASTTQQAGMGNGATATNALPSATPTTQQRIVTLAKQATKGSAQHVDATLSAAGDASNAATVIVTVEGPVPGTTAEIGASQERVKAICYQVEKALWMSGIPLTEASVSVVGPIYDDYADLTSGSYAAADLKAAAASTLDWASLSAESGWNIYGVWLRPAYRSKVLGQ